VGNDMKLPTAILMGIVLAAVPSLAGAQTLRFAIMRNGSQIGSHRIVITRSGAETSVSIATEVEVKVLFVTAYHFQQTESERWTNDRLVALNSTTDNNGTRHKMAAVQKANGLDVDVDGKGTTVDRNIVPASFWNPAFLQHSTVLDTQDGMVSPMSVIDHGIEQLTIDGKSVKAHHYEIKSRYSQDVWYDERSRLVQVQLLGTDGSTISYKPV
jgi:Family of unknown function (DUF6134)